MRGQRLGSAQTDRKLDDFQPVQHGEGFGLAAFHLEAEGRACALALAVEDRPIRMVLGEKAQIPDGRDRGMAAQKLRDPARAPSL